ncbi:MAG: sigma-E processing peptidase SpoIIGA [Oscillospiraceae bacterium]|nr:sigma-E processing peptidase SpoIIGA [Oscillospiraceae bacterium]
MIYIDILIAVNLFVNYFLLLTTAKLTGIAARRKRLILSAFTGALSSLLIFLPPLNFLLSTAIKIPLALLLVLISFGYCSFAVFVRRVLCFFAVNFIYAGVMFAIWFFAAPSGMQYNNAFVYFNISSLTLAVSTIAVYLLITGAKRLMSGKSDSGDIVQTEIELDGKTVLLNGFLDTGNRLSDVFTGLPVVIAEFDAVQELIHDELHEFFRSGAAGLPAASSIYGTDNVPDKTKDNKFRAKIRLIPYGTIGSGGLLAAFKPDKFQINFVEHEVLVGVTQKKLSSGEYSIILNAAHKNRETEKKHLQKNYLEIKGVRTK